MEEKADTLWVDVRTPSEYAEAHVPGAVNLPLFSDDERALVGTTYVQKSREEAIKLGLDLVGPGLGTLVREAERLLGSPSEAPSLVLYCARGGMRSRSVAWLLSLYGWRVQSPDGGFKAYKHRLGEVSLSSSSPARRARVRRISCTSCAKWGIRPSTSKNLPDIGARPSAICPARSSRRERCCGASSSLSLRSLTSPAPYLDRKSVV